MSGSEEHLPDEGSLTCPLGTSMILGEKGNRSKLSKGPYLHDPGEPFGPGIKLMLQNGEPSLLRKGLTLG